jgi:hypothetical protein
MTIPAPFVPSPSACGFAAALRINFGLLAEVEGLWPSEAEAVGVEFPGCARTGPSTALGTNGLGEFA